MEYITLNNNVKMPRLGFGTAKLEGEECVNSVLEALELGYRLIDTAQMYKNQVEVGNAIKRSGVPREELFITTKICRPSNSYEGSKESLETSLKELQLDYVDLLLIHEPYEEAKEMYRALVEAYEKGKVKAIGISNFNENLYKEFIEGCNIIPAVNQVEYHVFFQQNELKDLMDIHGTHMQAWSPFAKGKKDFFENEVLVSIGEKYSKTAAQVALRFLIQSNLSVIPKSLHKERMKENMEIFDFQLTDTDMKDIRLLNQGETLFGWY